jgi:hypothetical protein
MPCNALHLLNSQTLPLKIGIDEMPPTMERQPPAAARFRHKRSKNKSPDRWDTSSKTM